MSLLLLSFVAMAASSGRNAVSQSADTALVDRALTAELNAAQDTNHPMRYRLRKSSPRLTSTKEIVETRDGAVALLVAIDDKALGEVEAERERARVDALLADPGRQRHRKQTQDDDTGRALKVLRALPRALIYRYSGPVETASGTLQKFTFSPNPRFNSADLETLALTALSGEILIDADHGRVVRLEGHLLEDVDFGWGILGRLKKGGWIVIEQGTVGDGQWRVVQFKMVMSGRVLFRTQSFDTTEEESKFERVPVGLRYQQAIQMMRAGHEGAGSEGR